MSQRSNRLDRNHLQNGQDLSLASITTNNNDSQIVKDKVNPLNSIKTPADRALGDISLDQYSNNNNNNEDTQMNLVLASPMSTASMKELKKSYHMKKKYFTKNIQSAIDSTQEIHSGWLKARTTFKRWTKTWCQIKPGYLILYTSQEAQKKHRLGVVLLSVCQVIKRPTRKDGFCFKLINPFGCSVWAKSSTKAIVFAQASLTLRVSDETIGKLWLDALNRCHLSSNLEGYQSIIDEVGNGEFDRGSGVNSRLDGDTSDDEGDHSTRQIEMMLNNSNSTSETNSLSSTRRRNGNNNAFVKPNTRQDLAVNGTTSSKSFKNEHMNLTPRDRRMDDTNSHVHTNSSVKTSTLIGRVNSRQTPQTTKQGSTRSDDYDNKHPNHELGALSLSCCKMVAKFSKYSWQELQMEDVDYSPDESEELGTAGVQSEEVHDSNKNLLWHIIKQLRPGMDLSKVTLPTFILEPRSFLEKLADYYYHCDILSEAVLIDDPVERIVSIVKWYLSGFYKKPKGPKKPYNPILGERFRCFWDHPKTKSRTFFVAEQVSHHPPISAFHVSNRKDGYSITCALLSRSKFGGNSVSAILDGKAKLHLHKRNETYTVTMPYAYCRGILLGSLCMELGGKVEIECAETNCKCELDFKLASMWANQSSYNTLTGKILKGSKITHTLSGHWDKKIQIVDKQNGIESKSTLWEVTDAVKNSRLKRYTVKLREQDARESNKLWSKVTEALQVGNQEIATAEKTKLEDMQRREALERQGIFKPRHFQQNSGGLTDWSYKWFDDRVWDERRDVMQFEDDFRIRTLMLSPSDATGRRLDETSSSDLPDIDLPLTRISKFASQVQSLSTDANNRYRHPDRNENNESPDSKGSGSNFSLGDLNEETVRNIESRIAAGTMLFEERLKQVNERNKKLEEDIAILKRARGKRTIALILTALVVALISTIYKFLLV